MSTEEREHRGKAPGVGEEARSPADAASPRWRHAFARAAEDHAARHLQQRGCVLLATRFGCRGGEIDLIVEDDGVIAFVEVKARRSDRFGEPVEAVTAGKRGRIIATARRFLGQRGWRSRRCRFDVVSVRSQQGRVSVRWLRDAFLP